MADLVDQLMYAIGQTESGGDYTRGNSVSSATGKYQYLDSTWNNYGGYRRAKDAPPAVQDAKARADLTNKLKVYGGDVKKVIQSWFYPAGVGKDGLTPPGNTITMGAYAARVMHNMGMAVPAPTSSAAPLNALHPDNAQRLTDVADQMSALKQMFMSPSGADNFITALNNLVSGNTTPADSSTADTGAATQATEGAATEADAGAAVPAPPPPSEPATTPPPPAAPKPVGAGSGAGRIRPI